MTEQYGTAGAGCQTCVARVGVPVGIGLEHDAQLLAPLGRALLQRADVAAVPVEDEDALHAVLDQALADLEHHRQERFGLESQGALAVHPVRRDAHRHGGRDHHLGPKLQRRLLGHQGDAGRVVDHRQVLVVLLGGPGRYDHGLERAALQQLAELFARALPEKHLARVEVGCAGGGPHLRGRGQRAEEASTRGMCSHAGLP